MSRKKPDDPRSLSHVKRRMVDSHVAIAADPPEKIAYQHTVLCQTVLPYRNPGEEVREWKRQQGQVSVAARKQQTLSSITRGSLNPESLITAPGSNPQSLITCPRFVITTR
jgi:hypothetical protein